MERSAVSPQDQAELAALNAKIIALLPPQYQDCYDTVKPVSMGSAELKFGADGKVAWDQIWTSFCDLALAGGPPHRGTLLEPATPEEALAEPEKYQQVVEEIGRGAWLVTGLPVLPRVAPGWVGVRCHHEKMAGWLVRAIVVENVMARREQDFVYLPAAPHFRLAKEIKNVVTALAKTHHYWTYHLPANREPAAAAESSATTLLEPASPAQARAAPAEYRAVVDEIVRGIQEGTDLVSVPTRRLGWISCRCADEEQAVWLMRAVIVEDVLVRREGTILHLPASPAFAQGDQARRVVAAVARACRLWDIHRATQRPVDSCLPADELPAGSGDVGPE